MRSTWILDLLNGDGSVYNGFNAEAIRKTFEAEKMTLGGGDSVTVLEFLSLGIATVDSTARLV